MAYERKNLPWGYVEYRSNEIYIVSTISDPPKVRQASIEGISLGAMSWGRLRPDGEIDEMVLIQGKQDERTRQDPNSRAGEFTIHVNDGQGTNGDGMVPVVEGRHDGVRIKGINW